MKKITIYFLIIFSHITFGQTTLTENQKLVSICKVWGFLKYYHPAVASGQTNWNQELFKILKDVETAKSNEEFSLVVEKWISAQGEIKQSSSLIKSNDNNYFDKNFDLTWIQNDKLFSKRLSKKLKFIEDNRYQGDQYYVEKFDAGNVFIKNEDYSNINFKDKNSRILALFMYWNLMEYFFPYKYLMDNTWDSTLKELLPVFTDAKNEDDFYMAMQRLTVKINDSHAIFYKYPKKSLNFFPAKCKIIDEKIIVTEILSDSLAKADSIHVGDIITKVNDKSIKEIIRDQRNLINGSNEGAYLNNVVKSVLSGTSDSIKLEFSKEGRNFTRVIKWYNYYDSHKNENSKEFKKEKFKILDDNIGYVDLGALKVNNVPAMIKKLKSAKAIIFDMRNYPNGTYEQISFFLNSKEKAFAIYTKPDLSYPGRFKWSIPHKCGADNKDYYKGKVILLLNEDSLSQAEWTAMCFQTSDNITIIGNQTAGADGNVSNIDFIKAFHTQFSGIGVYYPDKRETQRVGITADIQVKPTIKGIQEGRDEILDRALKFVESGK